MSKYKVGDKVVLTISDKDEQEQRYYPIYVLNDNFYISEQCVDEHIEPLTTYIEQARTEGQNEAWELARKITCQPINGGFNQSEFEEIFGDSYISDVFEKYTYPEAAAKVAKWKKAKEEIKRGDVVRGKYNKSINFCVTDIGYDGHLYGVGRYGLTYNNQDPEYWEKIGRHIDIDGFLKQIGGEQE